MSCACDCGGTCGASEAALRDPLFARRSAAARGQTIGLLAVWPQETRDLIARINPSMIATDAAVRACTTLDPLERDAWAGFFKSWQDFEAEGVPTFGSARKYDEAEAYRAQLGGWQDELKGRCNVPGPKVSAEDPGAATASTIKWVVVGVVAVSAVYALRTVWPR